MLRDAVYGKSASETLIHTWMRAACHQAMNPSGCHERHPFSDEIEHMLNRFEQKEVRGTYNASSLALNAVYLLVTNFRRRRRIR